MTNFLPNQLNKYLITQSMLDNLVYDQNIENSTKMTPTTTSESNSLAMLIFHQSDIDAATYHLAKSIDDPTNSSAIRCVFVQESCVERFTAKLKSKLKSYSKYQLQGLNLKESIETSDEIISRLNAKTISPEAPFTYAVPLVWDFPQEHFAPNGKALPVVSLFSFRTVKEAIAMVKKETIYKGATIWCENHAMAYEVIAETPLKNFYLNCSNVAWAPIQQYITKAQPFALIENSYHYETLQMSGKPKNIVFTFGTSFAN